MKKDYLLNELPFSNQEYMSSEQLEFFFQKLSRMEEDLIQELNSMKKQHPPIFQKESDDLVSLSMEEENFTTSSLAQRYYKELKDINLALGKISNGSFGYCEESGLPIGLKRLNIVPTARFSIEHQKTIERTNKNFHDDHYTL